jgi:SAM-dependent methyltransferase
MSDSTEPQAPRTRVSRGMEEFFGFFRDQSGLAILDLGGVHQENINFITSLGHKYYSEDFLRIFHDTFSEDPAGQSNPGQIEYFLREALDYPDERLDGVLAWDVLEYVAAPLLTATVERLRRVMKPGGRLLAFFHSTDTRDLVPCYSFRILDFQTVEVGESGGRDPVILFNNRSLEKLFQKFESVKFFLTRERLREVIARR